MHSVERLNPICQQVESAGWVWAREGEEEEEEKKEEGSLELGAVTTSSVQKTEQFVPDLEGTTEPSSN